MAQNCKIVSFSFEEQPALLPWPSAMEALGKVLIKIYNIAFNHVI
jgi:hypothetical protein